jgi:predicted acyl esterase
MWEGSFRAALAACVVLCACAPAASAADAVTVKTLHFAVLVGPNDDVKCDVIGDLYTPAGVDKAHPAPAILTTNGFGGSKNDGAKLGKAYAARGYVVLSYSGLGFGGSTCKITLDDRDYDGKAGSQLVTFLGGGSAATDGTKVDDVRLDQTAHDGRHHDFDPRIGMIGGSYGGQIQFAVAGIDPRLDTIVPQITWNDLSYSLAPNNTALAHGVSSDTPGSAKLIWSAGFFAEGVVQGLGAAGDDPARLLPCPNFADNACLSLAATGALGGPPDSSVSFLRHASVVSFVDQIKIPTLLSQGETDTLFNLQEAVATYRSLKAQGTPVKLIWRSSGHSGGSIRGEDAANLDKPNYEGATYYAWFEHYLKDDPRAPSLDFSFFRDWVRFPAGNATAAYGRAASYPVADTLDQDLSSDGTLVSDAAKVKAGAATFLATLAGVGTSYSEISILDPGATPSDVPGTSAAFTGAPLEQDTEVVGVPSADLRFSAPLQQLTAPLGAPAELVVYVRLEDVAPDGSVVLPHKLVSPVRIAQPELAAHIELPGIVHKFAKGHRLRLVVYGGDLAYRGGNVGGPVSVLTDPSRPGVLHVPVARESSDYGPVVAASAPPKAACASRRAVVVHVKRVYRSRVRSGRVVVAGRTVARLTGTRTSARVVLNGRAKGTVVVKLVLKLRSGRTVTDVRRYRVCTKR